MPRANAVVRLKQEVDQWAAETRLLVGACRLLVQHFGSRKELRSWDAAMRAPMTWVAAVVAHFSARRPDKSRPPLYRKGVAFRCSEATARIVSPLAELVGGPVAGFVYTIRRTFPRSEQSSHILPYGHFSISFADAVTQPLWTSYRHLAPEEWKACFPAKSANRPLQRTGASGARRALSPARR